MTAKNRWVRIKRASNQNGRLRPSFSLGLGIMSLLALSGAVVIAQEVERALDPEPTSNTSECLLFTPEGGKFRMALRDDFSRGQLTVQVSKETSRAFVIAGGSRTGQLTDVNPSAQSTIDREIFGKLAAQGVAAAPKTTDYEFIRRVTLDLTGRIPKADRVASFVASADTNKRAALVDELLATPEFADKWTVYFGDLFGNVTRTAQVVRFADGVTAFQKWIRDSLVADKPYSQMATELLTATGTNSYEQGELNWLIGGFVTGSPRGQQDIFDQQAADVAETFLGINHENCILCHDGRRHLDQLSVWGKQETRYESWQLAAFFSKTTMARTPTSTAVNGFPYYWRVVPAPANVPDYPLNTTTGNRPTRAPIGSITNVAPVYPFTGEKPNAGENYRVALARFLTKDIQFSRAAVNYIWKEFFGRGIVDPVNQFDLMRLETSTLPTTVDPNAPKLSTLQPSHPELLNALAKEFQDEGFKLKALMRKIVLSEAYQLSSRYEGTWKAEYEPLFARKLVRRLWGEEILDSVIQVSNVPQPMTIAAGVNVNWAMQLPEPLNQPRNAGIASFLDSFYRGDRDSESRRPDGSITQVLNLMNDPLIFQRARASGTGATASFARQLLDRYAQPATNNALLQEMFLAVLSRPITPEELTASLNRLGSLTGNARQQAVEDVLWSLYNKVDFIYNY